MERCADSTDFHTSSPLKAKAASPNCAAYFFKHGHHHPAAVGVSDSQDNTSNAKSPTAAMGSEADVHELVNRDRKRQNYAYMKLYLGDHSLN